MKIECVGEGAREESDVYGRGLLPHLVGPTAVRLHINADLIDSVSAAGSVATKISLEVGRHQVTLWGEMSDDNGQFKILSAERANLGAYENLDETRPAIFQMWFWEIVDRGPDVAELQKL
ncbi:hypothetical protein N185_16975 [Sinorhizobium sp. GW3]|nr:hypothetical protein N185_16975 [Sinorhizobium sp. GW3]